MKAASRLLLLWLAGCPLASAVAAPLADYSAALDRQWNYDKPAESEARFRAEIAQWPATDPQALLVATQIARTQSLTGQFAAANATLDAVAAGLGSAPSLVRVRYLLERGRTFNSSGSPERAVPLFADALALAECNGDTFYAVDAAHMLGIAAPLSERQRWNLQALAMTEAATDARTKRWLAPLYNNIAQTHLDQANYAAALDYARMALPAWEARGDPGSVRDARWMIARAQRSLGALDDAERTQRALLAEYDALGAPDPYVYEELAEIALARGDAAGAAPWAARAHAALKDDPAPTASDPARIARLARIAAGDLPPDGKKP